LYFIYSNNYIQENNNTTQPINENETLKINNLTNQISNIKQFKHMNLDSNDQNEDKSLKQIIDQNLIDTKHKKNISSKSNKVITSFKE